MQIGLVFGIIVVALLIISQLSLRLDLTQGGQYSLSGTSKKLMGGLDDLVNVKVYFSKELPNYLLNIRQSVNDLLKEYQNYSGNKIKVTFIDPAASADLEKEAASLGIPKLQFNVVENDKYQVTNGYLGLAVTYGDKTEVLPVVENINNFEYDLTLAIKKVISKQQPIIAFATGHGEQGSSELTLVKKILEKQYVIRDLDLTAGSLVDNQVKTLILAGPISPYDERSLYVIDQFLMRGGSLLVLNKKITVDNSLKIQPVSNNLDNFLQHYGLKVNQDLVADVSNEMANFTQGYVQFFVQYPLWVKVLPQGFDKNNVMVSQLESLVLPWGSSVEFIGAPDKNQVSYLAKTTAKAWTQTQNFNLDPQNQQATFNQQTQGQKNLAIAVFGAFDSYYQGKTIPPAVGEKSVSEDFIGQTDLSRIIVMGNADFLADGFLQSFNGSAVYVQNIIDGLTQDSDLIAIRSKTVTDRGLKTLSDSTRNSIKYLVTIGPTLLIIAFGLLRFIKRRRRQFVDEL